MSLDNVINVNPYDFTVNNLSTGILNLYEPALLEVQKQLKELTLKQNILIIQIHEENLSLAEVQYSLELQDMFKKMNLYYNKLIGIKKDIKQLHERSVKLKKRALKLQQAKENQLKIQNEINREQLSGQGTSCAGSSTL